VRLHEQPHETVIKPKQTLGIEAKAHAPSLP